MYIYIVLIVKKHNHDISNSEVQKHTPISFVSPPKKDEFLPPPTSTTKVGVSPQKWRRRPSGPNEPRNRETFRAPFGSESRSHRFDEVLSALLSDFRLEQELFFFFFEFGMSTPWWCWMLVGFCWVGFGWGWIFFLKVKMRSCVLFLDFTNIYSARLRRAPKRNQPYSKHPFSGAKC